MMLQDFPENGYEVAGLNLEQPIVSDDKISGQVFDQSEFQNIYVDIGGGVGDSVEATLGPS